MAVPLDILGELASRFAISRDNVALLIVSGLGSLGTIGAAMAAWGAAKATRKSVEELKEARLQAVRPALIASVGNNSTFTVFWTAGHAPRIEDGSILQEPTEISRPAFTLTNVGTGTAINIQVDWLRAEPKPFDQTKIDAIRKFFKRGGFEIKELNKNPTTTIEIFDPSRPGHWKAAGFGAGAQSIDSVGLCPPDQQARINIVDDTIFALLLDILAEQGEYGNGLRTRTDEINISYSSISGEKFQQKYSLKFMGDFVSAEMNNRGCFNEEGWDKLRSRCGLSLQEKTPKASAWMEFLGLHAARE